MIEVPPEFATQTTQREGAAAYPWLAALPVRVEHYLRRWRLIVDGAPMHGYVGLVVPVRCEGGGRAALKLSWPGVESATEPIALAHWGGRGAVRLLDDDRADDVLLLERLDHRQPLDGQPIDEAVEVASELLRRLSVPAPPGLRTQADQAQRWLDELPAQWESLGRPFPRRLLDGALAACRELGPSAGTAMVNEDLHYLNVLRGVREPWLVIDPKVLVGDPEFGVIPLLWNRMADQHHDVASRFARIVAVAGLDQQRARGWTLLRAVENWLDALVHDGFPSAAALATIAEQLAR